MTYASDLIQHHARARWEGRRASAPSRLPRRMGALALAVMAPLAVVLSGCSGPGPGGSLGGAASLGDVNGVKYCLSQEEGPKGVGSEPAALSEGVRSERDLALIAAILGLLNESTMSLDPARPSRFVECAELLLAAGADPDGGLIALAVQGGVVGEWHSATQPEQLTKEDFDKVYQQWSRGVVTAAELLLSHGANVNCNDRTLAAHTLLWHARHDPLTITVLWSKDIMAVPMRRRGIRYTVNGRSPAISEFTSITNDGNRVLSEWLLAHGAKE